jgi:hypothetical protein
MIGWLRRMLGHAKRDRAIERVEAKVDEARSALSRSGQVNRAYWEARQRELRVVDVQVDARRRGEK